MKFISLIFSVFMLTLALRVSGQMRSGDNVTIDEVTAHDLYVAGGTVTINAPVKGDLIVAGGTVIVNDTVTQDILVAGGNIYLNAVVGDDIRCGGGTIELNNTVMGDFVVTGGRIMLGKSATVSGNLLCSGGEVTLNGNVKGDVKGATGTFTLNGAVEHNLECKGGKIIVNGIVGGDAVMAAEIIEIGSDAKFGKGIRYWNKTGTLDLKNSLTGSPTYDPALKIENGKWHYLGFASFLVVLWYLGTALVMTFVIQYLFSTTLMNAANTIKNASLKSLGFGFLFLVGVPMAIVIFFITVIGIPLGVLTLIAYVTVILLATVIVGLLISNWINNTYYQSSWGNGRIVIAAFVIFIFLKLASLTPFIGPLVMLLLACMAFGGILQNVTWKRNKALAFT